MGKVINETTLDARKEGSCGLTIQTTRLSVGSSSKVQINKCVMFVSSCSVHFSSSTISFLPVQEYNINRPDYLR